MTEMNIRNRIETPGDEPAIRAVHTAAFATSAEADLVDQLRRDSDILISMVADTPEGKIVGALVFSPVTVEEQKDLVCAALAPVSVHPVWQRQGIGTRLIKAGLVALERQEVEFVFTLGDPSFYERFGFSTELTKLFRSPFSGPAFQVLRLIPKTIGEAGGTLRYASAFQILTS